MGEEAAHLIVRMGRLKKEEEEGVGFPRAWLQ
jgi:hypothetical protein